MMEFASRQETALAMVVTARWLPVLIQSFEDGVQGLGFMITERSHFTDQDGKACPMLGVRCRRLVVRLGLRNAMENFLMVDREAQPVQVDRRLLDDAYARAKLSDVVSGRLEILEVLDACHDLDTERARLEGLAGRFAWLRAVFVEDARGPGQQRCGRSTRAG